MFYLPTVGLMLHLVIVCIKSKRQRLTSVEEKEDSSAITTTSGTPTNYDCYSNYNLPPIINTEPNLPTKTKVFTYTLVDGITVAIVKRNVIVTYIF